MIYTIFFKLYNYIIQRRVYEKVNPDSIDRITPLPFSTCRLNYRFRS